MGKVTKKEKIVCIRFSDPQYEVLRKEAERNGYGGNLSAYIRAFLIGDIVTLSLLHEIKSCEFQVNRIVNNIRQLIQSIYMTTEEKIILETVLDEIFEKEEKCFDSYKRFTVENQEQLISLEKDLQKIGYEIFDIVNDFLLGAVETNQKEKVIHLVKKVPEILYKRRCN